jgi:hypothetical protein
MTTPLAEQQRAALRELKQLAVARARGEADAEAGFKDRNEAAERELQDARKRIAAARTAAQAAADEALQDTSAAASGRYDEDHGKASRTYSARLLKVKEQYGAAKAKLETEFQEGRWAVKAVYEADKKEAQDGHAAAQRSIAATVQRTEAAGEAARKLLKGWGLGEIAPGPDAAGAAAGAAGPLAALEACAATAAARLADLQALRLPRYVSGPRPVLLVMLAWLVLAAPALVVDPWYVWLGGAAVVVALAAGVLLPWLRRRARAAVARHYEPLAHAVTAAGVLRGRCLNDAGAALHERLAAAKARHDRALEEAVARTKSRLATIRERRERVVRHLEAKYPPRLAALTRRRDHDLARAGDEHRRRLAEATARHDADLRQAEEHHRRLLEESARRHEEDWRALMAAWRDGLARFQETARAVEAECARLFPPWDGPAWEGWQPPTLVPAGLRFGTVRVGPERIPQGVPEHARLRGLTLPELTLSALVPFPERGALLLKAAGTGRTAAVHLLQAVMLRALTAIPPGKARFTILDPVGLGENFAAFTHLADYQEALVTSRIWTEAGHIEQRLADVTAHIENVIQQFLRNQFQTLEEYNAQAGEVAEPHRFVVVANFPVNFTPEAARRLVSIAASGARCGTHTLIAVDTNQPLPQGFQLADLEQVSTTLTWADGRFVWNDADYEPFPLGPERPADDAFATRVLHVVGARARQASRVEVPFDLIAPAPAERWAGDSRSGLRVPLGRAGALKKQYLQLGQGTAQHVLIAGKTGSGKSTLLHALVTQLALAYSPDEVELYLVDFKKGVEFKTYATHELPHARVVAIESEREFGLSVLQRLDAELKQRGEVFRALGVNDLAAARQAPGAPPLPRVLLVVDEFQEFFVEDDKVSQEAALLLDRLVRQGRAFGVHVLLGSQTLGGAYSLTRSTIDQMAVRIALQCSEADGHLILSKENGAARLLARPGEAIYNDANGRVEGNELFQTVWLSETRREQVLREVHDLARQRNHRPPRPQIVFEGTAPADLARNALLERLVEEPFWPAGPGALCAWLGEAVAIKDPTAAVFRRQGGANLLLVGQHAEAAANLMTAALLGLAAHQPLMENTGRGGLRCHLLGAGAAESPGESRLAGLPDRFGALVQRIGVRELPGLLAELATEVDCRHREGDTGAPPRFLFVHGLHRSRDLRRAEDDFGFSRRGEEKPNPAKLFATVLREGPAVGVFVVAWCDTLNNLNRAVDRQGLREFEMRVLFQLSAADSSTLIDSPLASKLGPYRALFYTEDQGRLEKFRPYGPADEAWLEALALRLSDASPHAGWPSSGTGPGERAPLNQPTPLS